jgi:haloalkane dehalogenase
MRFQVPEALYPFEHRFAGLGGGVEMHYVDEGEGEVLLMLHGNPSWSFLLQEDDRGSQRLVSLRGS